MNLYGGKMEIVKAGKEDIESLMAIRLEMLCEVNDLDKDYEFSTELKNCAREYFLSGNQTTLLAKESGENIGCASINYITIMPTFNHPTGKRAFLMSVYTKEEYRRRGIALKMVEMLIAEAKEKDCTEIILDATEAGRPLYKALGFVESDETMCLRLK